MRNLGIRIVGWSVAFLVTLEICARVDDRVNFGAPLFGPFDVETIYTYDSLGKTGKPGAQYQKWKLNSLGFRGPDLRPGTTRIMCIGSSETFGLYEQEEHEWPRRLEAALNKGAITKRFDVINAAYPGMSLASTLVRLPGWLSAVQPRVVIVYPSLANYISPPLSKPVRPPVPPKRPWFESRLLRRVETLLKSSLPDFLQDGFRHIQVKLAERKVNVMGRIPERNVARFRDDLEKLVSVSHAAGAVVVLVTHATIFGHEVAPELWPVLRAWRRFYPELAETGFLDMEQRLNDVMRTVARDRGLMLVDAARSMPTGHRTFVEFVHFTDEGADTLATLVAAEIAGVVTPDQAQSMSARNARPDKRAVAADK